MKRLFLAATAVLMFWTAPAPATPNSVYINNGVVYEVDPGAYPLQIDASTFINRGVFTVARGYYYSTFMFTTYLGAESPFLTWNTLNYTNRGTMLGIPGFRFDYSDGKTLPPFNVKYSDNFSNEKQANGQNASIYASSQMLIQAKNVYNSGTLSSSDLGYIKMRGDNVNLTRGTLELTGLYDFDYGFFDTSMRVQNLYWGIATTNRLTANFNSLFVTTSRMPVTFFDRIRYLNTWYSFTLTNGFTAYVNISPGSGTNYYVDALILGTPGPGISTEVQFGNTFGPSAKLVRWTGSVTNRVTKEVIPNDLVLIDTLAYDDDPTMITNILDSFGTTYLNSLGTSRPQNYTLISGSGIYTNWGTVMPPTPFDPALFDGDAQQPIVTNTAYGAHLTPEPHPVDPALASSTYSNVYGRIEITANKVLDLTSTRVQGQSFLLLESTNHFIGSTNARIISPYSTIRLASTNKTMTLANLLTPTVPAIAGDVEVWSGRWTNSNPAGNVLYNVTIVDGRVTAESSSFVDVLDLRADELVIGDVFNVLGGARLDAERLTITTNHPNSASERGELNFVSDNLIWSGTFPRLKYLTNYSQVLSSNTIYFAGSGSPPWLTGAYESPYSAFVNYGNIISHGNDTWANYYRFSGTNNSGYGPISVRAIDAALKDGALQSILADVYIGAYSLVLSNLSIEAGRSLTLEPTGCLNDGSIVSGGYDITNKQVWRLGSGINLAKLPERASLLATEVMLGSYYNLDVVTRWAGQDRGANPDAFVNNGAIGHLVLDGTNFSMFTFTGVEGNNALYVDRLELTNWSSLFDPNGERTGITLTPGFKLYFAQAIADGLDISDRLNGKNGGQFTWVPQFTGAFSTTNMVYEDGSTNPVNMALANDCNQDSDNDGIPNCQDPSPVNPGTIWRHPTLPVWIPDPNIIGGDGGGGVVIPPKDDEEEPQPDNGLPKLVVPVITAPYSGPVSAAGTYHALFYDPQGVTAPALGSLKVTVTSKGSYSAKLLNAGASYSFSGRVKSGTTVYTIRPKGKAAIKVSFVLNDPIGSIHGSVKSTGWSAELVGDRQAHSSKRKSPFAGRYTMVIPDFAFSGWGYGTVVVSTDGTVTWSAKLGDGTKASQGSAASINGVWPLYYSTGSGRTAVASWMQFTTNDLVGEVVWIKSGKFARQLESSGSRYKQPKSTRPIVNLQPYGSSCYGKLVITCENMQSITNTVVIKNSSAKATFPSGGSVTLQFTPTTGLFKGTFKNPVNRKPVTFEGAVVQDEEYGAGAFILNGMPGSVYLLKPAGETGS